MRIVAGIHPDAERRLILERAQLLPPALYESYEASVTRFFRYAIPASPSFAAEVQEVIWEIDQTVFGKQTSLVKFGLFQNEIETKSLVPLIPSLRLEPNLWGWIKAQNLPQEDLYFPCAHEIWHLIIALAFENLGKEVWNTLFPGWLVRTAATTNRPFIEFMCDLGAEHTAERLEKPSRTKFLHALRETQHLLYEEFVSVTNRLLHAFSLVYPEGVLIEEDFLPPGKPNANSLVMGNLSNGDNCDGEDEETI